jgi:hypothetical protein
MFDRLLDLHGETLTEKAKAIGPVGPNGGQNMLVPTLISVRGVGL